MEEINLAAPNQQKKSGFILRPTPDPEPPVVVPCCQYVLTDTQKYPVFWNPFNKVVQCHNCGHIWTPESIK
jgi:hypothetical protein